MSSSVGCITVTSAHCSVTSVPSCSYWLLFSPADFPSVSWVSVDCRAKWQIAPSHIPLCTTTQAAQQRLKVPPDANLLLKTMNSFFKAFFCFCVCQLFFFSRPHQCECLKVNIGVFIVGLKLSKVNTVLIFRKKNKIKMVNRLTNPIIQRRGA